MAGHYIDLVVDCGEVEIRFVCENHRGDPCHKQVPGAESWENGDPREIDTDECWAMSWWEAEGTDALLVLGADRTLARIPVDISYEEGILAEPVPAPAGGDAAPSYYGVGGDAGDSAAWAGAPQQRGER